MTWSELYTIPGLYSKNVLNEFIYEHIWNPLINAYHIVVFPVLEMIL